MSNIVYQTSDDLVRILKKSLRPYKTLIKDNTDRTQRFPFVTLIKCPEFDCIVRDLKSNNFEFNHSFDRKINKICRYFGETNCRVDERPDLAEQLPPQKKKKILDTLLDLNLINNENEDLDFEDDENDLNNISIKTNHMNGFTTIKETKLMNGSVSHKINGLISKSDNQMTNGLPIFNNTVNTNNSFKIPKKISQSIESIISHAESLTRSSKRPVDAFNYLTRYLTEEQWLRDDIMQLLLSIANTMVTTNDFSANVSKFTDLMEKIKRLKYIDDDFWDQIIYSVDKKKSDSKNSHQINEFLSNLHDYMMNNKISARIVCTDAVIIAYRIVTNHPTAKDLIDMQ